MGFGIPGWPERLIAIAMAGLLATSDVALGQERRVVGYEIVNGRSIPDSLTGRPGNAEAGRKLYFDRTLTGCSGCHGSPGGPGAQANTEGADAPTLSGVADRMDAGTIRMWLIAPRVLAPLSSMPGYYSVGQRSDENDPLLVRPACQRTKSRIW